jgi:hypothetical protein
VSDGLMGFWNEIPYRGEPHSSDEKHPRPPGRPVPLWERIFAFVVVVAGLAKLVDWYLETHSGYALLILILCALLLLVIIWMILDSNKIGRNKN